MPKKNVFFKETARRRRVLFGTYLAEKGILNYAAVKWTERARDEGFRALIRADEFQYIRIRHI